MSKKGLQRHPTQVAVDTLSTKSVGNSILAGYAAGISGTLCGHPLDSLKVWAQTNRAPPSAARGRTPSALSPISSAKGAVAGMTTLVAQESNPRSFFQKIRCLYAGVSGPLVTVGAVQSVNFAIYDSTRRMLHGLDHPDLDPQNIEYLDHDSLRNVALSSTIAGAILGCFTSPMLIIKTRQQIHGNMSFREAFRETVPRQMFTGIGPHMVAETMGRAVYFVTYEYIKRHVFSTEKLSLVDRMASAAAAGTLCWALIFPLDSIRSRMYALQDSSVSVSSMIRCMYAEQGLRSFYRGFSVTVLRAGPVAAAVLPVYDTTLNYLNQKQ